MVGGFLDTSIMSPGAQDWMTAEQSTGTTVMACEFKDGVVIGADTRSTTGSFVSNRSTDKLTKVTDYIYCCRSGSSADTQAISDLVNYHLSFHRMELGVEPQVKTAANLFQDICYNYRDSLLAGILVAGWDSKLGGQVYSVPIGGMCVRQKMTIGGSGSSFIYGYTDANYKPDMTKEECLKFVTNAISLAMSRDGSSGGFVRMGVLSKDGMERFTVMPDKMPKFNEP